MVDESTQAAAPSGNATPEHAAGPDRSQAENPRTRGFSPARDSREQQAAPQDRMVKVGESDFTGKQITDSLAAHAEQSVRKQSLPSAPDKYEIKLPADFKPPEGVRFEFDKTDPGLARFQQLAHQRGMDQETFSAALGIYAANKISEQERLAPARAAELSKLGSTAETRINSVETWLKARVGPKSDLMIAQMKAYPVAAMVESFEAIIRQFSNQGGADYSQGGRVQEEKPTGKIPGYDNMSFAQKRVAQMGQQFGAKRGQSGTER